MADIDPDDVLDLDNLILLDGVGTLVPYIRLNANASMRVESKDIRQILATRTEIAEVYNEIIYFRFYDRIVGKTKYMGEDVDMESAVMLNPSPRYFMPDRGVIYTVEELKNLSFERSRRLAVMLEEQCWEACFFDTKSNMIIQADPDKGDRILDKSELVFPKAEDTTPPPQDTAPEKPN